MTASACKCVQCLLLVPYNIRHMMMLLQGLVEHNIKIIPDIDVHPHHFYLFDLKLIIFWHSPGSGKWMSFVLWVFLKKKTRRFFPHS